MLDERGANEGPWFEDMFVTHTADALSINVEAATPLMTSAAVPEIVLGDDGRYYLFYGEGELDLGRQVAESGSDWFSTHGLIGYGALNLAVSDDGVTFEPVEDFEVVEIVRGVEDPFGFAPEFFLLPDSGLRMFYNSRTSGGALMSMLSYDGGQHWTDEGERVGVQQVEAVSLAPAPQGGWLVYYHYWQEGYSGDYWGGNE